jgi:hypothetical protein
VVEWVKIHKTLILPPLTTPSKFDFVRTLPP